MVFQTADTTGTKPLLAIISIICAWNRMVEISLSFFRKIERNLVGLSGSYVAGFIQGGSPEFYNDVNE